MNTDLRISRIDRDPGESGNHGNLVPFTLVIFSVFVFFRSSSPD